MLYFWDKVVLSYDMLCNVMLCYVTLHYVMLCYVMLCYAMLCYIKRTRKRFPAKALSWWWLLMLLVFCFIAVTYQDCGTRNGRLVGVVRRLYWSRVIKRLDDFLNPSCDDLYSLQANIYKDDLGCCAWSKTHTIDL